MLGLTTVRLHAGWWRQATLICEMSTATAHPEISGFPALRFRTSTSNYYPSHIPVTHAPNNVRALNSPRLLRRSLAGTVERFSHELNLRLLYIIFVLLMVLFIWKRASTASFMEKHVCFSITTLKCQHTKNTKHFTAPLLQHYYCHNRLCTLAASPAAFECGQDVSSKAATVATSLRNKGCALWAPLLQSSAALHHNGNNRNLASTLNIVSSMRP